MKQNLGILKWMARAGREYGVAYQLGGSLRDTANPPARPEPTAGQDQQEVTTRGEHDGSPGAGAGGTGPAKTPD